MSKKQEIIDNMPDGFMQLLEKIASLVLEEKPDNINLYLAKELESQLKERDGEGTSEQKTEEKEKQKEEPLHPALHKTPSTTNLQEEIQISESGINPQNVTNASSDPEPIVPEPGHMHMKIPAKVDSAPVRPLVTKKEVPRTAGSDSQNTVTNIPSSLLDITHQDSTNTNADVVPAHNSGVSSHSSFGQVRKGRFTVTSVQSESNQETSTPETVVSRDSQMPNTLEVSPSQSSWVLDSQDLNSPEIRVNKHELDEAHVSITSNGKMDEYPTEEEIYDEETKTNSKDRELNTTTCIHGENLAEKNSSTDLTVKDSHPDLQLEKTNTDKDAKAKATEIGAVETRNHKYVAHQTDEPNCHINEPIPEHSKLKDDLNQEHLVEEKVIPDNEQHPVEDEIFDSEQHSVQDKIIPDNEQHSVQDKIIPDNKQHQVEDEVIADSEQHPVEDKVIPDNEHPVEDEVIPDGDQHSVEDEVIPDSKQHPVEGKVITDNEQYPVEDKIIPNSEQHTVEDKVIPGNKQHLVEDEVIPDSEQHPVEDEIIFDSEQPPAKDKVIPDSEQHPVKDEIIPDNEQQPVDDKVILDNKQSVEDINPSDGQNDHTIQGQTKDVGRESERADTAENLGGYQTKDHMVKKAE